MPVTYFVTIFVARVFVGEIFFICGQEASSCIETHLI